jgi:hypothetical protein
MNGGFSQCHNLMAIKFSTKLVAYRISFNMRTLQAILLCIGLTCTSASQSQTPCEWFDWDGSGVIGANTWVYVLGQYDTAGEMDVDSSGWVNVRDLLEFLPFYGTACYDGSDWYEETTGHIEGLILTEWEVHETELTGLLANIPAGSITYRLYAELSHEGDHVLAVYGDDEAPLNISSDGTFYGFGGDFGTVVVDDYNSNFTAAFPANAFSTMLSCGEVPEVYAPNSMTGYVSHWLAPLHELNADGDIALADTTGGAWFSNGSQMQLQQDGLVFLGQFTIVDGSTLEGTLNLLAKTETDGGEGIETLEGMTFSSDNIDVLGCTDADATNFDPSATYMYGMCLYPGDYDEDGMITVSDLLALLSFFGCESCPDQDLTGDGFVTVQDILIWLGLFG